jgi:hypothetical protein
VKVFDAAQSRTAYFETQRARSTAKFGFCKVSAHDVARYDAVLRRDRRGRGVEGPLGPILCLGTRNGREIDLFRTQFFGARLLALAVRLLEYETHSLRSLWPAVEAVGRSDRLLR